MCRTIARSGRGLRLGCRQRDDVWQTLQQQFELVLVQTFVALSAEVVTDILVELLAQQPVLQFLRNDTGTHLI